MLRLCFLLLLFLNFSSLANTSRNDWYQVNVCHLSWGKSTGNNLHNKGFYLNSIKVILEHAGYKVATYVLPWNRCLAYTKNETMDILAIAWLTEENSKDMLSPSPVLYGYAVNNYLITNNMAITSSSPAAIKGMRFGSPALNALPDNMVRNYLPKFASVTAQSTQNQSIRMLLRRRLDLIYSPIDIFLDFYAALPVDEQTEYKVLKPAFNKMLTGPLFTKTSSRPERQKKLIKDFNNSYIELCRNGTLHKLLDLHESLDGIISHLSVPDAPNLLTHCSLIKKYEHTEEIDVDEILIQSGHK